ncbi:uncharacterized protein LOC131309870 [Rhododendron vialii]|uniref:uncharacterized protein LOC131309870 n=1 Tax=Rhododendron vialii TaxID=182163 RepID=UPI00265DC965|nr:uncharacterized protein LOC131309870 [Rhododendron vialii]
MAKPCCSIEMEPRTLNEGLMTHAREAAVDIVQKNEPNEASSIFMKGLEPVVRIKETVQIVQRGDSIHKLVENEQKTEITETTCQCVCNPGIMESPDLVELKEPLSAPF